MLKVAQQLLKEEELFGTQSHLHLDHHVPRDGIVYWILAFGYLVTKRISTLPSNSAPNWFTMEDYLNLKIVCKMI